MSFLKPRNISLISFAAFTWSIFYTVQRQFLNDYVAELPKYTPLIVTLMVSLVGLTSAISSVIAGAISDNLRLKVGRRKLFIIIGGLVSAIIFFLIPLSQAIVFIIGLNVVMGLFNSAAFVCNNSFIPDITPDEKLGKINSIAAVGTSLGTVAGFAIMLINPASLVFYVAGAVCSIGFLVIGLFIQEPTTTAEPKKWYHEIKETFQLKNLKKEQGTFRFFVSHVFLHTGINVFMPFLMIFLTQQNDPESGELVGMGLTFQEVLIIFAVMTGVSLLATIPIGFLIDKSNNRLFLMFSRILFALVTSLFALGPIITTIPPIVVGIIFIIPFGIFNTADIISRGALMHDLPPGEKRGQFLGLILFLAQLPGVIIGGLIAQFFQRGYQFMFIAGAVIILLSVPFVFLSRSRPEDNESSEPSYF